MQLGLSGGHKTETVAWQRFWWLNVRRIITSVYKGFSACAKIKSPASPFAIYHQMLHQPTCWYGHHSHKGGPFYKVGWSVHDPQSRSFDFSQSHSGSVVPKPSSVVIIHSDQGSNFESTMIKELCKLLKINKTHINPYHPQGNWQMVRANTTLITIGRAFTNISKFDTWAAMSPRVMTTCRASIQESIGITSNLLSYGRELRLSIDVSSSPLYHFHHLQQHFWSISQMLHTQLSY